MTQSSTVTAPEEEEEKGRIPTLRLALMLGAAIVLLLSLLTYLAPLGTPVPYSEFQRLSEAQQITSIDVGETAIVGYLETPQPVQGIEGGGPEYAQAVRIFRADNVSDTQLAAWRAAGLQIRHESSTTDGALGPYTWVVIVGLLLAAGGWHLIDQALRHRRYGSPRQRIADLEKELDQGKIDPDRYRREVEQLSTEL